MAITSYGYDGTVLEAPWAKLSRFLGKDYAVASVTAWAPTAVTGVDRTVKIAAGDGFGKGVMDVSTTDVTLQAATLASGTRWDTVVMRRNWSTNTSTFVIVTGSATMALAGGLNANPGTLDDQPIALVQITAGVQVPTAVVDLRKVVDDAETKVGEISAYPAAVAPQGSILCDGRAVNRVQYAALFALIGTTFGAGDGSTTFNVPNLKSRVIVGVDAADTTMDAIGEVGGAKTVALTSAEIPGHVHDLAHGHTATVAAGDAFHSHTIGHNHGRSYGSTYGGAGSHAHTEYLSDFGGLGGGGTLVRLGYNGGGGNGTGAAGAHDHSAYVDVPDVGGSSGGASISHAHTATVAAAAGNTGSTGGGGAHNNLQPYMALNWIIKA